MFARRGADYEGATTKEEIELGRRTLPLMLVTSRGAPAGAEERCANCYGASSNPIRFSKSTWGPVVVCGRCRDEVLSRSFGPKDLWAHVVGRGGR